MKLRIITLNILLASGFFSLMLQAQLPPQETRQAIINAVLQDIPVPLHISQAERRALESLKLSIAAILTPNVTAADILRTPAGISSDAILDAIIGAHQNLILRLGGLDSAEKNNLIDLLNDRFFEYLSKQTHNPRVAEYLKQFFPEEFAQLPQPLAQTGQIVVPRAPQVQAPRAVRLQALAESIINSDTIPHMLGMPDTSSPVEIASATEAAIKLLRDSEHTDKLELIQKLYNALRDYLALRQHATEIPVRLTTASDITSNNNNDNSNDSDSSDSSSSDDESYSSDSDSNYSSSSESDYSSSDSSDDDTYYAPIYFTLTKEERDRIINAEDAYTVLGLSYGASLKEAKDSYTDITSRIPHTSALLRDKNLMAQVLTEVKAAYDTLKRSLSSTFAQETLKHLNQTVKTITTATEKRKHIQQLLNETLEHYKQLNNVYGQDPATSYKVLELDEAPSDIQQISDRAQSIIKDVSTIARDNAVTAPVLTEIKSIIQRAADTASKTLVSQEASSAEEEIQLIRKKR